MFVKFVKYRYLDNFNFLCLRKRLLMKKYSIFFVEGLLKKYVRGDGFVFNVFVWFKEVGSYRMILNLGLLNEFVGY